MKKKRGIFILGILLFLNEIMFCELGETKAATSYTNAREFYESTENYFTNNSHIEVANGYLYYATIAKMASSSSNLKYQTVGYDINLSGNGLNIDVAVKRGGILSEVPNSCVEANGYQYLLYQISYEEIQDIAKSKNPNMAKQVLESSRIKVTMNAIITTKQGTNLHGNVSEDGNGGLNEWGTIYHLGDNEQLAEAKRIFSGHTFESYINIWQYMPNYTLTIKYNLQGGTVGNGYSTQDNLLYQNGKIYTTQRKQMQEFTLVNQNDIALIKTGYHIDAGQEWTFAGKDYSHLAVYMPIDLCPVIASGNKTMTVNANWKPNTYKVIYDAGGGDGYMMESEYTYDVTDNLRILGYTKTGYHFDSWNTKPDGTGMRYENAQTILNLTSVQGGSVILYAQWIPDIYAIMENKMGGLGGTEVFYEKYGEGWYEDKEGTRKIMGIAVPSLRGYQHLGYFTSVFHIGDCITDSNGKILAAPDYFASDRTIYADWEAKQYKIIFDKQGGAGGTDSVEARYDEELPTASQPMREGYTFQGYYTKKGGKGTQFYNACMAGMKRYDVDGDLTLYAYWKDTTPPEVILTSSAKGWTNRPIVLTAEAYDTGSGLSKIIIYCGDKIVAKKTGLQGALQCTVEYKNPTEGVINYRAVAVDMDGNTAEAFRTIYYDITAPTGEVKGDTFDGTSLTIEEVFVTDYKVP